MIWPTAKILNAVNLADTPAMLAANLGIRDQSGGVWLAAALLRARDNAGGFLSDTSTLEPLLEAQPALMAKIASGPSPTPLAPSTTPPSLNNASASPAPSAGLSPVSHQVLSSLADSVGAMADRAAATSQIYSEIGPAFQDYVHAVRSILTGTEMPVSESPTGSAPITAPQPDAVAATQALGNYLPQMADALAATGASTAQELQNVTSKEIEEKKGGTTPGNTGGGPAQPGPSTGGSQGGGTPQPGGPASGGSNGPSTGGTPATPGQSGGGPSSVGKPTSPGTPANPGKNPGSVSRPLKQVERRCYQFRIRNQGQNGDISDIFFLGMTPAVQPNVPAGWQGLIGTAANPGFGWQVKSDSPQNILKAGQQSPLFSFCLDNNPATVSIFLSHPDKTQTKLEPGDLLVRGAPPRVNQKGEPVITSTSRSYITQYQVTVGDSGVVSLTLPGGGGLDINGTAPNGQHVDGVASPDGKTVTLGGQFPPGTVMNVEVQTRGPNAAAQVNPKP